MALFGLCLEFARLLLLPKGNKFPVGGKTVLVTGGSRGMGRSVARELAQKGANVIIVARDTEQLKESVQYISEGAMFPEKQKFHYISADLTFASEAERVISEATTFNGNAPPHIVWCCAGSSYPTLFVDTPIAQLRKQMDSNYFSSAYVAHATLQAWLKPGCNSTSPESCSPHHLIFTASLLSFFTLAGYTSDSPTKAALRSLSDTLSQEMNLYASPLRPPIRLHTIFPGAMFTKSYEAENLVKSDLTKELEEDDRGQTADEVAKRSIGGLERGEELVATTWMTRMLMTSSLGGSVRSGLGLLDTVLSWVMSLVMVFVRRKMDYKVREWRKEHGQSGMRRYSRRTTRSRRLI